MIPRVWTAVVLALGVMGAQVCSADADNLCPNPGAEEGGEDGPAGWFVEFGPKCTWADDSAHSGARSLKIESEAAGPTIAWTSPMIPVPEPGAQFALSIWSRLENVTGGNGAFAAFYHTDADGNRIGQSGMLVIGGAGREVATQPWKQYFSVSNLTEQVRGVRVNLRLYGAQGTAWFDDVEVSVMRRDPLEQPCSLRRGLRAGTVGGIAVVSCDGGMEAASRAQEALLRAGCKDVPILAHDVVDLAAEKRDLIVLGNVANSSVAEYLYLRLHTYEDLYYPGEGGYVLRPLLDPLGTGANMLVIGASDDGGLNAAVAAFGERARQAGEALDIPLTVSLGKSYGGPGTYPWPGSGPRREMKPAAAYLLTGDLEQAEEYRSLMLRQSDEPDDKLFGPDTSLHLFYVTKTMSWDLMHTCPVFSADERLKITNFLLKVMRSGQGYGYSGISPGMRSRENHATRAARAFYYGWRHFSKYYPRELEGELPLWRAKLQGFWAACLASSRSYEDSLSQHALGGSLDNALDISFQEPEWSEDFFAFGRARRMGERCIAISNNMGDTVLLGDTGAGDYSSSVFSKLAYRLRDGRYTFMVSKRGARGTSTDEPVRGFNVGIEPRLPEDHLRLKVIPADDLYFRTALGNTAGVSLERAFDKLTFRSGFDPQDEYLLIDGVAGGSHSYDDANSIGEFSANSRRWLCEIDIFNGPTMSFHNAVTVARDGLGSTPVPQAAELVRTATWDGQSPEDPGPAYTATRLPRYNGTDWTRHVLWMPRDYTVVLDELEAGEPGDYSFVLGWRSLGEPSLKPGLFEARQDEQARPGLFYGGRELVQHVAATSGKYLYHLAGYNALLCRTEGTDDFVEVEISVPEADEYQVAVHTLDYVGRGIVQVSLDGRTMGQPIDLYTDTGARERVVQLGSTTLEEGPHTVRFDVVGKNEGSDGYYLALTGLGLFRPEELQTTRGRAANRFRLVFPTAISANLDRDTETLGKYLPPRPYRDQALNILEQTMNRSLGTGETACFQNVFCARAGAAAATVDMRAISDHCLLVRSDEEVALVGAATRGAAVEVGDITASGKLFYIAPSRALLLEAAAKVGDEALSSGEEPASAALIARTLESAWQKHVETEPETRDEWPGLTEMPVAWSVEIAGRPLSLAARRAAGGLRLAVGTTEGLVCEWDNTGQPTAQFEAGGPVHALEPADLDGDGGQELLVGSDDEHVYALDENLRETWKHKVPFLRDEQPWMWWTLNSSKVRRIHAADISGDGRPEILLGVGNMRLHCLDASGDELWRYRTDHGICTTIATADVFADGKVRVLAGNGLTSSSGNCWVLDENGKVLQTWYNGSWCTSLPAVAVGDLDSDGTPTVFCGNNRGHVRAYAGATGKPNELWIRDLTRPIRSLTVMPAGPRGLIVVGSDSGYLCAFDQPGGRAWGTPLTSAITHTRLVRRGQQVLLAAGCKDGNVFLVASDGNLVGHCDAGGRLEDMIVADVDGDARSEIVAVLSGPDRLCVVRPD